MYNMEHIRVLYNNLFIHTILRNIPDLDYNAVVYYMFHETRKSNSLCMSHLKKIVQPTKNDIGCISLVKKKKNLLKTKPYGTCKIRKRMRRNNVFKVLKPKTHLFHTTFHFHINELARMMASILIIYLKQEKIEIPFTVLNVH